MIDQYQVAHIYEVEGMLCMLFMFFLLFCFLNLPCTHEDLFTHNVSLFGGFSVMCSFTSVKPIMMDVGSKFNFCLFCPESNLPHDKMWKRCKN